MTTLESTSMFSEVLGHLAYAFNETQPYIPMYTHLILSALFPIFTGAHASLNRPTSAADPPKKSKKKKGEDDSDEDDESMIQKMEGMSPGDALAFPVIAGCMLTFLYFVIKWAGAQMLNKILGWYFASLAVFSVAKIFNDGLTVVQSFIWPRYYAHGDELWEVKSLEKTAVRIDGASQNTAVRTSPLPGYLGRMPLSAGILRTLWTIRNLPGQKYLVRAFVHPLPSVKGKVTLRSVSSVVVALGLVLFSNIFFTPWWLTNIQGFAFSYSALQLMSPTTFGTGSLILIGLFFYDIYFVFYTPVMISVASSLDVPIKLLFPRPAEEGQDPAITRLAMLGLGDIVLPGIFIGLALRFDLYMYYLKKQTRKAVVGSSNVDTPSKDPKRTGDEIIKQPYKTVTGLWGDKFWTYRWGPGVRSFVGKSAMPSLPSFPKPYFYATVTGYVIGMCVTLGVMQVFQHGQPALLYLVPGVLGSAWMTALVRGELKQMWEFSEAIDDEEEEKADKEKEAATKDGKTDEKATNSKDEGKWSSWLSSLFDLKGKEKSEARLRKDVSSLVDKDEQGRRTAAKSEDSNTDDYKQTPKKDKRTRSTSARDPPNEIIFFSVTRVQPSNTKSSHTKDGSDRAKSPVTEGRVTRSVSRKSAAAPVSEDSSEDAVVISNADIDDEGAGADFDADAPGQQPRWRGSKGPEVMAGERAGKRLRTL